MDSKYFKQTEFECKCGCKSYIPNDLLIEVLTEVREHFGVPVIITSSTRCEQHNKNVGGSSNSQHKLGTAADIIVKGIDTEEVYEYLNSIYPTSKGIGLYYDFVHIDVRDKKARWVY